MYSVAPDVVGGWGGDVEKFNYFGKDIAKNQKTILTGCSEGRKGFDFNEQTARSNISLRCL